MTEVEPRFRENVGTCGVEGCDRPHEARGFCPMHYRRWQKHGDPGSAISVRTGSDAERFWAKVDKLGSPYFGLGPCWLWLGTKTKADGYGRFFPTGSKGVLAHRWAYEQEVGPIPVGMQLDHLCRTKGCVRPSHLEPVSNAENQRRIPTFKCGHPKDEAHSYVRPSASGRRECLICLRERNTRYQRRSRGA